MSEKYEQLASSLESSEDLIQAIIGIVGEDNWNDKCQSIWENPSQENMLDIANMLKSGVYNWGLSKLTIPESGSVAYIIS